MKYKIHIFFFILTICLFFTENLAQAQKVTVETTNLEIIDNELIIEYNFIKSKENHRYNVWVEVTKSSGEKINALSFNGDVGDNLLGGENKRIVWNYNRDGIVINDDINIEVFASITVLGPGMGKAIMLSAIFPGLGLSKLDPGKPYWLMGLAGYGLLTGSVLLNKQASSYYEDYKSAEDEFERDDLFYNSESKAGLSKTLGYSAIGIWGISIIWTAIKASSSKSTDFGKLNKKQKVFFYSGIDPRTKSAGFTLKYKF